MELIRRPVCRDVIPLDPVTGGFVPGLTGELVPEMPGFCPGLTMMCEFVPVTLGKFVTSGPNGVFDPPNPGKVPAWMVKLGIGVGLTWAPGVGVRDRSHLAVLQHWSVGSWTYEHPIGR